MNKPPSLSDVIKLIQAQLDSANEDNSGSKLSISSAKVSLGFSITQDETGSPLVTYSSTDKAKNHSEIMLKFSINETHTPSADKQDEDGNDFESFKKNFDASVKRKHGQPGLKKKNIFDCD